MIEITKFFKGKINWINFIVLEREKKEEGQRKGNSVFYLSTWQTQFFQNFKYTFFRFTRGKCFTNTKDESILYQ